MFSIIRLFLKNLAKLTESYICRRLFSSNDMKVVGWKGTPVHMHSCELCEIFKNDYLVVNVRTAAFDILGYPYVGISSSRSTLKKHSIIDILQGSKYVSVASFFKYFPLSWLSSFVYLDKYMNILFFLWKCAATLLTWRKSKM